MTPTYVVTPTDVVQGFSPAVTTPEGLRYSVSACRTLAT
jgi:hypothetical protein